MRFPFAWTGKITCAIPVMTSGYRIPVIRVMSKNTMSAGLTCFRIIEPICPRIKIQTTLNSDLLFRMAKSVLMYQRAGSSYLMSSVFWQADVWKKSSEKQGFTTQTDAMMEALFLKRLYNIS